MSTSDFDKVLEHFDCINFCGQASDPMIHPSLDLFLSKIYKANKTAKVHTAISQPPIKKFIKCWEANPNAKWVFAIDGLPEDSHKYRVNQNGSDMYNIMINSKDYLKPQNIIWQYIVFKYNEDHIEQAIEMAKANNIKMKLLISGRYNKSDPLKPSGKYMVERPEWIN
jgi:hypothetical protein